MEQSITTTFNDIWNSQSQLRLMVCGTVSHKSITTTFNGILGSQSQLRLTVSGAVNHKYV